MQPVDVTRDSYVNFVTSFLSNVSPASDKATVLALQGELGAGKTTLTQEIASALGVSETVTSPTFVVQKIYPTNDARWSQLVHIDAYRIEDRSELGPLRISELWCQPATLVVLEWPERILHDLPEDVTILRLTSVDETTRRIEPISLTDLQS